MNVINWYTNILKQKITHRAKQSIDLIKPNMKNSLRLVMVYNMLIKPGSAETCPQNNRITRDMRPGYATSDILRDFISKWSGELSQN